MTVAIPRAIKVKMFPAVTRVVERGLIEAIVSTETEDREGDIIRADGWVLDHFTRHPVLLSSHDYHDLRKQIGEWESMEAKGGKLIGTARYYIGEGNDEADWAYNLAAKGRAAYSVGFIPLEWVERAEEGEPFGGYEFTKNELLEVSHVVIPANPEALQTFRKTYPDLVGMLVGMAGQQPAIKQTDLDSLHDSLHSLIALHSSVCQMADGCPLLKAIPHRAENAVPSEATDEGMGEIVTEPEAIAEAGLILQDEAEAIAVVAIQSIKTETPSATPESTAVSDKPSLRERILAEIKQEDNDNG